MQTWIYVYLKNNWNFRTLNLEREIQQIPRICENMIIRFWINEILLQ